MDNHNEEIEPQKNKKAEPVTAFIKHQNILKMA
jgi:hypothetical protein